MQQQESLVGMEQNGMHMLAMKVQNITKHFKMQLSRNKRRGKASAKIAWFQNQTHLQFNFKRGHRAPAKAQVSGSCESCAVADVTCVTSWGRACEAPRTRIAEEMNA
jgi:hypothetical protein